MPVVTGTVKNPSGTTLEGVTVEAYPLSREPLVVGADIVTPTGVTTTSDGNGVFTLALVDLGSDLPYRFTFRPAGERRWWALNRVVPAGGGNLSTFLLPPDGSQSIYTVTIWRLVPTGTTPDRPTGGTIVVVTGAVNNPPAPWLVDVPAPLDGYDLWASRALVNPATQTGIVPAVWSDPYRSGGADGWRSGAGAPTYQAGDQTGDQYLDTSTGDVYQSDGIVWTRTGNIRGPRGDGWRTGSGVPTHQAGDQTGDLYLDLSTGDVYESDGTAWSKTGNIRGPQGLPSTQAGPTGPRGDGWRSGSGVPTHQAGDQTGDLYLDLSTGDVYESDGTTWTKTGNLRGPTGPRGDGWRTGSGVPTHQAGDQTGDLYLDLSTGDVYESDGTAWSKTGNIRGPQGLPSTQAGPTGPRGDGWRSGSGVPTHQAGDQTGDLYLDLSTGDVYESDGTTWTKTGNLRGPTGPRGDGWRTGSGVPTHQAGDQTGDLYLDLSTGDVYESDGTAWSKTGNIRGPQGLPSTQAGPTGPRGDGWRSGSGVPTHQAGDQTGDLYLDLSTGDVYESDGTTWTKTGNLRGPTGPRGDGWRTGSGVPTHQAGDQTGDLYLDLSTGDVYESDGTAWSKTGNIRGPQGLPSTQAGPTGPRGDGWRTGSGVPTHQAGDQTGDLYLRLSNGDVYESDGTAWSKTGNIRGPQGLPSTQAGPTGPRGDGWRTGSGVPTHQAGDQTGDLYLDLSTGDVYESDGTAWTKTGNIRGPTGPRGDGWRTGSGTPTHQAGDQTGDLYLDLSTGDVYEADGTAWTKTGNLRPSTLSLIVSEDFTASATALEYVALAVTVSALPDWYYVHVTPDDGTGDYILLRKSDLTDKTATAGSAATKVNGIRIPDAIGQGADLYLSRTTPGVLLVAIAGNAHRGNSETIQFFAGQTVGNTNTDAGTVDTDDTLTGDGSSAAPLSVSYPFSQDILVSILGNVEDVVDYQDWRGNWQAGSYTAGQVVKASDGNYYLRLVDGTDGGGDEPTATTANWEQLPAGLRRSTAIFHEYLTTLATPGGAGNQVTVSTAAPSGGADGDVWFRVSQTAGQSTDVITIHGRVGGSWTELDEIIPVNQNNVYQQLKQILQQGTGVTLTEDDTNDRLTITAAGGSSGTGDLVYTPVAGTMSLSVGSTTSPVTGPLVSELGDSLYLEITYTRSGQAVVMTASLPSSLITAVGGVDLQLQGGGGSYLTLATNSADPARVTLAGNSATGGYTSISIEVFNVTAAAGSKGDKGDPGDPGSGSTILVQDEGTALATAATTLNFVGTGVTATGTGAVKTVTIPSGGGFTAVEPGTGDRASSNPLQAGYVAFSTLESASTAVRALSSPELGDTALAIFAAGRVLHTAFWVYTEDLGIAASWARTGMPHNTGILTTAPDTSLVLYGADAGDDSGAGIEYQGLVDASSPAWPHVVDTPVHGGTGPIEAAVVTVSLPQSVAEGDYLLVELDLIPSSNISDLGIAVFESGTNNQIFQQDDIPTGTRAFLACRVEGPGASPLRIVAHGRKTSSADGRVSGRVYRVSLMPQASLGAALAARIARDYLADEGGIVPGTITRATGHALPATEVVAWTMGTVPPVVLLSPLAFPGGLAAGDHIGMEIVATGGGGGTAPQLAIEMRDAGGDQLTQQVDIQIDGKVRYYDLTVVAVPADGDYRVTAEALAGSDSGDFTVEFRDVLGFAGTNRQGRLAAQIADRLINLGGDMGITTEEAIALIDQLVPPPQRVPPLAGHGHGLVQASADATGLHLVAPSTIADDVTAAWAQPGQPEPSGGGSSGTTTVTRLPHPTQAQAARAIIRLRDDMDRSRLEIVSRAGGAAWNGYTFQLAHDSTPGSITITESADGHTITMSLGNATRTIREWADLMAAQSLFTSNGDWYVNPVHYAGTSVAITAASDLADSSDTTAGGLDAPAANTVILSAAERVRFDGGSGGVVLPSTYTLQDLPTGMAGGRFRVSMADYEGYTGVWLGADYPAPTGPDDNFGADVFIPNASVLGLLTHIESGQRVYELWMDEFQLYAAMNDIVRYHWATDPSARVDEGGHGVINPHDYNAGAVVHYDVRVRIYAPDDLTSPAVNSVFAIAADPIHLGGKAYRKFLVPGGSSNEFIRFVGEDFVEVEVTISNSTWAGVHLMRDWVGPMAQDDWGDAANLNQTAKAKAWRAAELYEPSVHQLAQRTHDNAAAAETALAAGITKGDRLGVLAGAASLDSAAWATLHTDTTLGNVTTVDSTGGGWSDWLSIPHPYVRADLGRSGVLIETVRASEVVTSIFVPFAAWHMAGGDGDQVFAGLWRGDRDNDNDRMWANTQVHNRRFRLRVSAGTTDTDTEVRVYVA